MRNNFKYIRNTTRETVMIYYIQFTPPLPTSFHREQLDEIY